MMGLFAICSLSLFIELKFTTDTEQTSDWMAYWLHYCKFQLCVQFPQTQGKSYKANAKALNPHFICGITTMKSSSIQNWEKSISLIG